MAANAQTAPRAPRTSIPDLLGEWIRQGAEGVIATQKILLDLAAQQNALALTVIRERLGVLSPSPSKALIDLAGKGVENFMEAQKVLLDLAARQNAIVAEGLKPSLRGTPIAGIAEVVTRSVDQFIGAQKHFLETAGEQTDAAIRDYREGKNFDTSRLSSLAREGKKTFIESQKKFLDIVEEQVTRKPRKAEPADAGRPDVFALAKDGVDAFVEAQKRLLDLASSQIDVNVEFTREVFSTPRGKATTSMEALMRKSVDSFVAAQKALAELASKPRKAATPDANHEPAPVGAE